MVESNATLHPLHQMEHHMISRSSNLGPSSRRESSVIHFYPRGGSSCSFLTILFYFPPALVFSYPRSKFHPCLLFTDIFLAPHPLSIFPLFFSFIGVCRIVFARHVFKAQAFVIFSIFLRTALLAMWCLCEMFNNLS